MRLAVTAMALAAILTTPAMANEPMQGKDPRINKTAQIEAKTKYMFDKADADGNGVISKLEHEAFANTMFRNADRNKDNVVTYKEMKAAKVAEMNEMKQAMRDRAAVREARELMEDDYDDRYDDDRYDRR